MVDRVAAEQPPALPPPPTAVPLITEMMTVNHVLSLHPRARAIFQAFKIDCSVEGISCLDELCWWRGIDVTALLQVLNRQVVEEVEAVSAQG